MLSWHSIRICSVFLVHETLLADIDQVSYNIFIVLFLCSSYSCFTFSFRIVMPYRTFFCYANSTQEADEWIKILQWKLVSVLCIHLSYIKTLLYNSLPGARVPDTNYQRESPFSCRKLLKWMSLDMEFVAF